MSAPASAPVTFPPTSSTRLDGGCAVVLRLATIAATTGSSMDCREATLASIQPGRATIRTGPLPAGACFAYRGVTGPFGQPTRGRAGTTSAERAALILDEAEVAVVPGEAFGASGYLRLSYAVGDTDLAEGVARIQKLFAEAR